MSDTHSSEPGFESPPLLLFRIFGFSFSTLTPSWLSCLNEYLAIYNGGNVSDFVFASNCSVARMLPGEANNGVGMYRSVRGEKSVKLSERSNGPDTALYKN